MNDPVSQSRRSTNMTRVLIASPNCALDHICLVPTTRELRGTVRADREEVASGGKGTNVSRALRNLGIPSRVFGITAGRIGSIVEELAGREGLDLETIRVEGETRIASLVIGDASSDAVVINPPGPMVLEHAWKTYARRVLNEIDEVKPGFLVCSGSLPQGVPTDAYNEFVIHANTRGAFTVVDVSGSVLSAVLRARPRLVKVNAQEASGILDKAAPTTNLEAALLGLRSAGADQAIITSAEHGAVGHDGSQMVKAESPSVRVYNTVGSGDAFLAGFVSGYQESRNLLDGLRAGTACGSASVESLRPGDVSFERYRALRATVRVELIAHR